MSSVNESTKPAETPTAVPQTPLRPRPPRSLHVELMVSYLSLLAVVVIGFGGSIYILMRQGMYHQAESELLASAQLMGRELKSHGKDDPFWLRAGRPNANQVVAQGIRQRFGPPPRNETYFAIWDAHGQQIVGSERLPQHATFAPSQPPRQPLDRPRHFYAVTHDVHLDVYLNTPDGRRILVGRPLFREFEHLRQLLLIVTIFGLISLAAGAAGAWWLARRIVKPIDQLTQAAEQITAKSLDQRLELVSASSELTRLSTVFNTMLDRLHGAFQRQIRFTADASHELRTPVAVILSQAEHSLSRSRSPEDYCSALDTCLRAARRMKRLVDDLLLLARADSGRLDVRLEPLDLAEVVRQSLAMLEPLAKEQQVRLSCQLLTTLTIGDAARLAQVVTNLVTNALQYNRPEGEVFVTVHARESKATLVVSDTGIGIPAADQPRLFERFFRADQARTHREGQGTGLGLSIVSEIVAAHQGTIEVTSELGVGTTVTVQLSIPPVGKSPADPTPVSTIS